jgi:dephospho-CoA kinase
MGKSTTADLLRTQGLAVVDSDLIARQVVEPGQPALAEIQASLGEDVVDAEGCLRRAALADRIFADPRARRQLEAILHPKIRSVWRAQLQNWRAQGIPAAVAVIPLLFETDAAMDFDATICVACTRASQHHRLRARGWTDEQIDRRIAAQMPIDQKMLLADYVVWSEGGLDLILSQLRRLGLMVADVP